MATTEFQFIIANLLFVDFQKRNRVTEVVVFVSFNFSIYQGQYQRLNHHCHSHSDSDLVFS